jgi:hypothetical protein
MYQTVPQLLDRMQERILFKQRELQNGFVCLEITKENLKGVCLLLICKQKQR